MQTLPIEMAYKQSPAFSWSDKKIYTDGEGVWTNGIVAVWEEKPFVANYNSVTVLTEFTKKSQATMDTLKELPDKELEEISMTEVRVMYDDGPCYARFENETTSFWINGKQLKAALNARGPWSWAQAKQDEIRLLTTEFPSGSGLRDCLVLEQSGKVAALIMMCNGQPLDDPDLHITLDPDYERLEA